MATQKEGGIIFKCLVESIPITCNECERHITNHGGYGIILRVDIPCVSGIFLEKCYLSMAGCQGLGIQQFVLFNFYQGVMSSNVPMSQLLSNY